MLERIEHFFKHYKDLEKGKWVEIIRWGDAAEAKDMIRKGIEAREERKCGLSAATIKETIMKNYLFTSESVGEGHPDKVCDRISNSIVDLYLRPIRKPSGCGTLTTTNRVVLAGEVRSAAEITPRIWKRRCATPFAILAMPKRVFIGCGPMCKTTSIRNQSRSLSELTRRETRMRARAIRVLCWFCLPRNPDLYAGAAFLRA